MANIVTRAGKGAPVSNAEVDANFNNLNTEVVANTTKLANVSVTQAVDLDTIELRVNALDTATVLAGLWDASAGTYPSTTTAGMTYIVSVAGTVGGIAFNVDDRLLALVNNPSTTVYATNWLILDYTDKVLSVAGRTGAVVVAKGDVGLGSVDNTSDANKPVSTAQQTALDLLPALIGQAEAEAGTATTERTVSALRIAQAIDALAPSITLGEQTKLSYISISAAIDLDAMDARITAAAASSVAMAIALGG
jgi:hypothetical protein